MKTKRKKDRSPTLGQIVKAARKAGAEVNITVEDRLMPLRFKDDPEPVKLLIAESERCTALGLKWLKAPLPNHVAADQCMKNGWAYALAAAWMRCKLKGELLPEKKDQ